MLLKWSEETMSQTVGFDNSKGSALFFSILQATYQLPYNSGILVFTGRPALDEDLATLALQEATKKRIRLFVIWNGAYSTGKNEERIIKEAALRSGGAFFTNRVSNFNRAYTDSIDATKTKVQTVRLKNDNLKVGFVVGGDFIQEKFARCPTTAFSRRFGRQRFAR